MYDDVERHGKLWKNRKSRAVVEIKWKHVDSFCPLVYSFVSANMVSFRTRSPLASIALLASLFAFVPSALAESKEDVSPPHRCALSLLCRRHVLRRTRAPVRRNAELTL